MNEAVSKAQKVYRMYHGPSKTSLKLTSYNGTWYGNKKIARPIVITSEVSSGQYGSVLELGHDKKYVLKIMSLGVASVPPNNDLTKIFLNEIRVGTTHNIQRVGPRIYSWRITKAAGAGKNGGDVWLGQYIMDNVLRGNNSLFSYTLHSFIEKYKPGRDADVFKKLKKTIRNFWIITQGYHGDLHSGNISVVADKDGTVKRVMIYDYGAHKRTKVLLHRNASFKNLSKIINANFERSVLKRPEQANVYPKNNRYMKSRTYAPILGQMRRPNGNVLRTTNLNTGTFQKLKTKIRKSIMSALLDPKKRNITNYFKRI